MKQYDVNGTKITTDIDDITEAEAERYLSIARENSPGEKVTWLWIADAGDGNVGLDWNCMPPKFERIRRITGNHDKKARQVWQIAA